MEESTLSVPRLVTAPSFPALEAALLRRLPAHLESGRRVLLLTPTRALGRRLRHLAFEAGLNLAGLRVQTPRGLIQELGGAQEEEPLPGAGAALLRTVARNGPPGPLATLAADTRGQRALLETFSDIREGGYITPGAFTAAVDAIDAPSPRLRELAALYERYEPASAGYPGLSSALLHRALDAARQPGRLPTVGAILLYGFVDASAYLRSLIEALSQHTALAAYLPADATPAQRSPDSAATETLSSLLRTLGAIEEVEPELPATGNLDVLRRAWPRRGDTQRQADRSLAVVSAPNSVREMREAVREVVAAVRAGVPHREIALLWHQGDSYAPLAEAELHRAGVPAYLEDGRPYDTLPAGRAVRQLLMLVHSPLARAPVMEFITSAPLRLPEGAVPSRWDRLSRRAGVIKGAEQWHSRLGHLIDRMQQEAAQTDGAARTARLDDAAAAGELRRYVQELARALDAFPRTGGWDRFVDALHALAEQWLEDGELAAVLDALAELRGLTAVEPITSFEEFRTAALVRLAARRGAVGDPEHGVFCGEVSAALGLRFRVVCLLGVAEGAFPASARIDPLLPDHERAALGLATSTDLASREPELFRLLLGAASARLVLSYPRAEPGGTRPRQPSYFLLKAGETLLGRRVGYDDVESIPGFRRLAAARFAPDDPQDALDEAEYDLSRIEQALNGAGDASYLRVTAPELIERAERLAERRQARTFTPLDGVFAGEASREAVARWSDTTRRPLAPTAIEAYATCPQRYFLANALGLEPLNEPDNIERIEARDRGRLMHDVLERFFRGLRDDGELPLRPERLPAYRARLLETLEQRCKEEEQRGRTGVPLLWTVDRAGMADDLLETLDEELAHASDGYVPAEFEQPFGLMGAPAAEQPLADGRTLRFRGFIDRIDRTTDGRARVIDYKTGRPGLTTPDRMWGGTLMQAPVYLLAAQRLLGVPLGQIEAQLFYASRRGNFRRAVFHGSALAQRDGELQIVLATVADGVGAGRFFPYPRGGANCRTCDFARVCDIRVQRLWERKQHDPAAGAFIAMTEIQ